MRALTTALLCSLTLCPAALARDLGDVNTQWRRPDPPNDALTMQELVAAGYEVKTAHPASRGESWLYLQKGSSVFRCNDEIFVIADSGIPVCLELVPPYKRR